MERIRAVWPLLGELSRILNRAGTDLGIETIWPSSAETEVRQIESVALGRWETARRARVAAENE